MRFFDYWVYILSAREICKWLASYILSEQRDNYADLCVVWRKSNPIYCVFYICTFFFITLNHIKPSWSVEKDKDWKKQKKGKTSKN